MGPAPKGEGNPSPWLYEPQQIVGTLPCPSGRQSQRVGNLELPDKREVPRPRVGRLTSPSTGRVTEYWALPQKANPKRAHGRGGVISDLTVDTVDVSEG